MNDPLDQPLISAPARLSPVPAALVAARTALHAVAEQQVSAPRKAATGKIGLRATPGGFGTPGFGDSEQVRVEGTDLVAESAGQETERRPLGVDGAAAKFLADWFAFGASVLTELRAGAGEGVDPSLIQLWPEHFDIAVELGSEAAAARATYGFSPGDDEHPEPYVYVSVWQAPDPDPLWNATAFSGAELLYAEIVSAGDQRVAVLEFLRVRLGALTG